MSPWKGGQMTCRHKDYKFTVSASVFIRVTAGALKFCKLEFVCDLTNQNCNWLCKSRKVCQTNPSKFRRLGLTLLGFQNEIWICRINLTIDSANNECQTCNTVTLVFTCSQFPNNTVNNNSSPTKLFLKQKVTTDHSDYWNTEIIFICVLVYHGALWLFYAP